MIIETNNSPHRIVRIQVASYRYPIDKPVDTSFGRMTDRPAVFIRLEEQDGNFGWGEIFANWPAAGAEHRVNLVARDLAPLILNQTVRDPSEFFSLLSTKTHIRALQCGEWGPFQQCIAGIDTAIWDMKARAHGLPVRKLLNSEAPDQIKAYASGIHIDNAEKEISRAREEGFKSFKVKVGFNSQSDAQRIRQLSKGLTEEETLFADANQGFNFAQAKDFLNRIADIPLGWIEEPIVADAPIEQWQDLARYTQIPLAAGENIAGHDQILKVISNGFLKFLQPDVAKWGGISGCVQIAREALDAGLTYCPHFLGGGIGLAASGEILAATSGSGLLEVDVNPNPLRTAFDFGGINPGTRQWQLSSDAGLGFRFIPDEIARFMSHSAELVG